MTNICACLLSIITDRYDLPDAGQWPCQSGCLSHVSIVNNRSTDSTAMSTTALAPGEFFSVKYGAAIPCSEQ